MRNKWTNSQDAACGQPKPELAQRSTVLRAINLFSLLYRESWYGARTPVIRFFEAKETERLVFKKHRLFLPTFGHGLNRGGRFMRFPASYLDFVATLLPPGEKEAAGSIWEGSPRSNRRRANKGGAVPQARDEKTCSVNVRICLLDGYACRCLKIAAYLCLLDDGEVLYIREGIRI